MARPAAAGLFATRSSEVKRATDASGSTGLLNDRFIPTCAGNGRTVDIIQIETHLNPRASHLPLAFSASQPYDLGSSRDHEAQYWPV